MHKEKKCWYVTSNVVNQRKDIFRTPTRKMGRSGKE